MLALENKQFQLLERLKGTLLAGEASGSTRDAGAPFTPCALADSLLEAVAEAAKNATSGDVVLLSPACSSWDQFQNHQHRGEVLWQTVKSIGRGVHGGTPNIDGKTARMDGKNSESAVVKRSEKHVNFASGFFEARPRCKANQH
jgi:hypothetical protein